MSCKFGTVAVALMIACGGQALANDNANTSPLSQGKPAGTKEAISFYSDRNFVLLTAGGFAIAGLTVLMTGTGHGSINGGCLLPGCTSTPTTTSTTPTTPTTTNTRTTPTTTTTRTTSSTSSTGTH